MNKHNRQVKKMVFNHLDAIYKTSVSVSKSYASKLIPLSTIYETIKKSKLEDSEEMPEGFVLKFNSMLDVLYDQCFQNATKSRFVYPKLLKAYIYILKKSFIQGLKK